MSDDITDEMVAERFHAIRREACESVPPLGEYDEQIIKTLCWRAARTELLLEALTERVEAGEWREARAPKAPKRDLGGQR